MFKDINWLGLLSLLFTLNALFLSATLYLFIFGMFFALLAMILAHYAKDSLMVKISRTLSALVLLFGVTVILVSLT